MGAKIRMDQIFSKLKKLWQNWRWANGIRVEYFPGIHYVAAQWRSHKFTVEIRWDTREFHRKTYIHVDVQRHLLVDQETMKKNACQMPISFLYMQGDSEQDNGHLLVLVQRKSGILSMKVVHKVNGTIWRKGWCWNSQKADIQSSVPRVHCPRGQLKSKGGGKIVDPLLCQSGHDYNYFSHNYFCKSAQSLRSSHRNVWRVWNLSR